MKKVRVTIPKYMGDILKYDAIEFGITKNYLLNYLVRNQLRLIDIDEKELLGEKEIVQFNLNKKVEDEYIEAYNQSDFDTEANFMRSIIYGYVSRSKVVRERLIFNKLIKKIEDGIKKNKKIKIKFDDREKIVSPYSVLYSNMEVSNYLFCHLEEDEKYKNYRISNIRYVYILEEISFLGDKKYLEKVKQDFDPFLSYGLKVTIKLNKEGKQKYQGLKTNRPKLLEKKGDIWIVEGSDEKIKRYFSYFMGDVEIVKPLRLRNWFLEGAEKILKL
ncbi:MAG: WYL domain-containing protein [Psychrilyobacter sp.]|nr:WYL domain-containing protein [Psychrilyobacter sp.]